ncbi:MAG: AAA family ATPase, partial [Acidimicrobiales bacterium]
MGAVALLERETSMARVAALLARLRAGHGSALFVIGEPGLGKTALLDAARRLAPPDIAVGFGQGDAMETAVPFGLMGQVLRVLHGGDAQAAAASAARADRFYS